MYFLGYADGTNGVKIEDPTAREVLISRDYTIRVSQEYIGS